MATQIYVGNLPYTTTEESLKSSFEEFGIVDSAKIIKDRDTGRSKGFGFVEMASQEEAEAAIEKLNDSLFGERKIKVSIARPRENRERRGGYNYRG